MRSLMTWKPATTMPAFADVDRFLDRFFTDWSDSLEVPAADILERDDHYLVRMDLPGLRKEDIQISVEGDNLTVTGRREAESSEEKTNYVRHERRFGSFTRSFRLGTHTNAGGIEAHYRDGVLELRVPKSEEARPRLVEVK